MASNADAFPEIRPEIDVPRMIAAAAMPATTAPAMYLQMAASRQEAPKPIGRPAYQNAGIKKIQ